MAILAGPILRRTEAKAVNVWLAFDQNIDVALILRNKGDTSKSDFNEKGNLVSGSSSTIKVPVGKSLCICLVTFVPETAFSPGKLFFYDVVKNGTTTSLLTDLITKDPMITYSKNALPSFVLPAANLKDLIVAHGSCRKMHGDGPEALSLLDKQLTETINDPAKRIQQLFLTGDQVYADEIPRYALWSMTSKAAQLINPNETLPLPSLQLTFQTENEKGEKIEEKFEFTAAPIKPEEAPPGLRAPLINTFAKMTTNSGGSHLMTFGEYCMAHLSAWSVDAWEGEFRNAVENFSSIDPNWDKFDRSTHFTENFTAKSFLRPIAPSKRKEQDQPETAKKRLNKLKQALAFELKDVDDFRTQLPLVRRVLANTPTYMIFDDHEITDDWNISMAWKNAVYSNTLGKAVVRNGLMAYALCQDIGNVPDEYANGTSKRAALLEEIKKYAAATDFSPSKTAVIDQLVGIDSPTSQPQIKWHYSFKSGDKVRTLFLDTRNRRGFTSLNSRPELLDTNAFTEQFNFLPAPAADETLFVISACPAIGPSVFEELIYPVFTSVKGFTEGDNSFASGQIILDNEAWYLSSKAFETLLTKLSAFKQAVVFSGDVHYGFTTYIDYWKKDETNPASRIIQLVSTPLKNLWKKNIRLFQSGFAQGLFAGFGGKVEKFGWANPPKVTGVDLSLTNLRRLRETPAVIDNFGLKNTVKITPNPDWRYRLNVGFDDRTDDKIENLLPEFKLPDDFSHTNYEHIKSLTKRFTEDFKLARSRRLMYANHVCVVSFSDNKLVHSFLYRSADDENVLLKMVHAVPMAAAGDEQTPPALFTPLKPSVPAQP